MQFYRLSIVIVLIVTLHSCSQSKVQQFDIKAQEVSRLRDLFWSTGDTAYIYQGVAILDSLISTNLSQKDFVYCENLMEQLYLDVGKIREAMALRIQVNDSSRNPETFYESMALMSYCDNEIDKMKDYCNKAFLEFEKLAKHSSGSQKIAYTRRQLDINLLSCNYQKADSLYHLLERLDNKSYYKSFDSYCNEVSSNLEDLKRQYNECEN